MFTGHPKGLYRLFFIEMWERLAFYTMVGILMLYATDTETGGLGLSKVVGNEIYGLYLAFVYFTPYLGGLIADRFLGYRRSVLIGGLFFALGFYLMSIFGRTPFVLGLVCLCLGNGFFKPNISAMVGNLYKKGDPKRDFGFNLFYMGINIGSFLANFVAAFARNQIGGWSAVFLCAMVGMLIGVVLLLASWKVLAAADRPPERSAEDTSFGEVAGRILSPALACGVLGYYAASWWLPTSLPIRPATCGFLAGVLPVLFFFVRLPSRVSEAERTGLRALLPIYLAGATFFMVLHLNGSAIMAWGRDKTSRDLSWAPASLKSDALPAYYANAPRSTPRPSRENLLPVEAPLASMFGQNRLSTTALEQAQRALPAEVRVEELPADGTAPSEAQKAWQKRAVKVYAAVELAEESDARGARTITAKIADGAQPVRSVAFVRTLASGATVPLFLTDRDLMARIYAGDPPTLAPGEWLQVVNPELFKSLNGLFVILLTPLVVMAFGALQRAGRSISTARKIFLGLALTTLSLGLMVLAGVVSEDGATKVSWAWLVLFYLVLTTGELCLSPMALSLVTKLSPKRLVGLTMGGWFVATSFGNNFSGFFGGLESQVAPTTFFLLLAAIAAAVATLIFLLLPRLDRALEKYGA
ncbi:MAG: MFS transporter [Planctomycetes bacterium]|nr:MFS transporter [Planctomycetota bacterium]